MSGKFGRQHASALAKISAKGALTSFTLKGIASIDETTEAVTPGVDTVVTCYAIEIAKNPRVFQALGLVMTDAPMLEAVPLNYGDTIPVGSTVPWAGETYTVASVLRIAPDGVTILAKVIVKR